MFLVIYGHLLYNGTWRIVNRAIYSFHMPMYFILAGYVLKPRHAGLILYIKRKFVNLIIPGFFFIIITLPIYAWMQIGNDNFSFFESIKMLFFVGGRIPYNDPVWFLFVMFQVVFLFELLGLLRCNGFVRGIVALTFFTIGYLVYIFCIKLPFGLDKMLVCMGFYITGSLLKEIPEFDVRLLKRWELPLGLSVIWLLSGVVGNEKVSLYSFALGKYWLFIISGITGSLIWFKLSYVVRKVSIFSTWGQNTVLVLGTHYVGVTVVKKILSILGISNTIYFDIIAIVISLIALVLYIPICKVVNRFFPILNGHYELSK